MHTYIDIKILPEDAEISATFIMKMNNLIDLLNSNQLNNFDAFMQLKSKLTV